MGRFLFALLITATVHASEPSLERQKVLRNMLKHDCGACHGLTRKGGLGPSLLPEALADKSDALLVQTIQDGRKGTPMPPWKMFITAKETQWLIEEFFRQ